MNRQASDGYNLSIITDRGIDYYWKGPGLYFPLRLSGQVASWHRASSKMMHSAYMRSSMVLLTHIPEGRV